VNDGGKEKKQQVNPALWLPAGALWEIFAKATI